MPNWPKTVETDNQELKTRALRLIREAYEVAEQMQNVNLSRLNAARPQEFRYRNRGDLIREFTERANAMVQFAGDLGLITVEEALLIAKESSSGHPDRLV
jgi:hypothetical protein